MMLLYNVVKMRRKVHKHATHTINYRCHLCGLEYYSWLLISRRLALLLKVACWPHLSTLMLLITKLQKGAFLLLLHPQHLILLLLFLTLILLLCLPPLPVKAFLLLISLALEIWDYLCCFRGQLDNIGHHLCQKVFTRQICIFYCIWWGVCWLDIYQKARRRVRWNVWMRWQV